MGNRSPLELDQTTIADQAEYLTAAAGDKLYWASLTIGRVSLKTVETVSRVTGVYELNHIGLLDTETETYPAARYVFDKGGLILGVINSRINHDDSNNQEVKDAMKFQAENGLFAPGEEDYEQLVRILQSGTTDAPIIRADINEK